MLHKLYKNISGVVGAPDILLHNFPAHAPGHRQ